MEIMAGYLDYWFYETTQRHFSLLQGNDGSFQCTNCREMSIFARQLLLPCSEILSFFVSVYLRSISKCWRNFRSYAILSRGPPKHRPLPATEPAVRVNRPEPRRGNASHCPGYRTNNYCSEQCIPNYRTILLG